MRSIARVCIVNVAVHHFIMLMHSVRMRVRVFTMYIFNPSFLFRCLRSIMLNILDEQICANFDGSRLQKGQKGRRDKNVRKMGKGRKQINKDGNDKNKGSSVKSGKIMKQDGKFVFKTSFILTLNLFIE